MLSLRAIIQPLKMILRLISIPISHTFFSHELKETEKKKYIK